MDTATKVTARQQFERVLAALDQHRCEVDYKPGADKAKARCPVPEHDDQTPSLSISVEGERVLAKCHAGCTFARIAEALELPQSAFFADGDKKKVRPRRNVVKTPYYAVDATGTKHGIHWREDFTYADDGTLGKKMWWEPDGIKTANMPLWNTPAAPVSDSSVDIWLCEGEKKAQRLQDELQEAGWADVVLATMTGAGGLPCDDALRILLGRRVTFWYDNDKDGKGQAHMRRIAQRLLALGADRSRLRYVDWQSAPPKADAWDYFEGGATVDGLEQMVKPFSVQQEEENAGQAGDAKGESRHTHKGNGNAASGKAERAQQQGADGKPKPRSLVLQPVADVKAERSEWLFDGHIPIGELSVLAGAGGAGKTMVAIDLIVRGAGGLGMPNGARCDLSGPVGGLYLTTENHPNKVLRPRIEAAAMRLTQGDRALTDAILRRVYIQRGIVTWPQGAPAPADAAAALADLEEDPDALILPRDIALLKDAMRAHGIGFVVIDPVISFTPHDLDVLNPADMRHMLDPLVTFAQETNSALCGIVHFTKQVGTAVVLRVAMSRQLTDTARVVSVVLEDPRPECEAIRWLAMAKNNLGARPPAHAYRIVSAPHPSFPDERTAVVEWTEETLEGSADVVERTLEEQAAKLRQQLGDPYGARGARGPRTQDAVSYLGEKLHEMRDNGDLVVTSEELEQWRLDGQYSKETWSRARDHLGIETKPDDKGGFWTQDLTELKWLRDLPSNVSLQHAQTGRKVPLSDLTPPTPRRPVDPPAGDDP